MKTTVILLITLLAISCKNSRSITSTVLAAPDSLKSCSDRTSLEYQMNKTLSEISTDTNFSFYIESYSGEKFGYNRGSSTMDTSYHSASSSKWVTAAVVLRLVERMAGFSLNDKPQDQYSGWSVDSADSIYSMTLSNLLSLTSGLNNTVICLDLGIPFKSFDDCLDDVELSNIGTGRIPGSEFYYSSTHLQLAGAMAISAGGYNSWQELFIDFQNSTGLFQNSVYDMPRRANPRLAGGMTFTGRDYVGFLRALTKDRIFSASMKKKMFTDRLQGVNITNSPARVLGEEWHYGYGVWLECPSINYNCNETEVYSSPGAFGTYPFINIKDNFFGIVARQGNIGTFRNGKSVFDSVRVRAKEWANCVK